MQRWRLRFIGLTQIPNTLTAFEASQFFTFSLRELTSIKSRRGQLNRLGAALQVGFLKMSGRTLNSVQILPRVVLQCLGEQLNMDTPTIASIRGLYKRKRTLHDHQQFAIQLLGLKELTPYAERGLIAYLRREATHTVKLESLRLSARRWLVERSYLIPGFKVPDRGSVNPPPSGGRGEVLCSRYAEL